MNAFKVFGEFLDLLPETVVNLTMRNPIFADDNVIPGSFSLPLDIPFGEASPKNSRILKNIDLPEASERLREVDADYYYDGIRFFVGKLMIGKVNKIGNRCSVHFKFGGLTSLENIKNIKLKTIVDEQIVLNNNVTYVKEVALQPNFPSSPPFAITINGKPYEEASIAALVATINADVTEPRAVATDFSTYFTVKPFNNPTDLLTPFTVDGEGRDWTVTPNDEDWNEPIRSEIEDRYLAEPYFDNKIRFPWLINKGQFEPGYQYFESGYVNASEDGAFRFNYSAPEGDGIINFNPFISHVHTSLAPYVLLKHILDKIADHYGFVYDGDFYTQPWIQDILVYTPNSITKKIPFMGQYGFFFFRQDFNIGEFVPDLTVAEFFKALQTRFNLAVYYKEKDNKLVMKFRKSIVQNVAYKNIQMKSSPMFTLQDIGLKGIKLKSQTDSSDKLSPLDEINIGTEQEDEIPTSSGTLSSTIDMVTADVLPAADQLFTNGEYKFLKLLVYEGLQESNNGFMFPKASVRHVDFDLLFSGEDGLYETQWLDYIRTLTNRKEATLQTTQSLYDLVTTDWEQKVMIDRSKYLYAEINVSLGMNNISPADVTVYKV